MKKQEYRIGWLSVYMTSEQADRWNMGESTPEDFDLMVVCVPRTNRGLPIHDEMNLFQAMENHPEVEQLVNEACHSAIVAN